MKTIGRKYQKRVQIYQVVSVADGYGGNLVEDTLITESWAEIKTVSNNSRYVGRLTDLGITDPQSAIIVTMRQRNDITYNAVNQFLMYRGEKYIIQNLTNVNLQDNEIEIIAVKEQTRLVNVITPIE